MSAASGSMRVRLFLFDQGEVRGTRIEVTGPGLAPGLTLRPESQGVMYESLGSLLGRRNRKQAEVEVGDEDFDRQVSVQGSPALALALLDPELRRTFRALLRGRLEVRGHPPLWASGWLDAGVLLLDVPKRSIFARGWPGGRGRHGNEPEHAGDSFLDGEYRLPKVLRAAAELAARLVVPEDLAARLAANLADEPEAGVRLRILLTLLREFPEHPATAPATRAALGDPDAEVRARAGIALGAQGRDVLLGVAGGEGAEDSTSARAVAALGAALTREQAAELLQSALRTLRPETAKACMGVLARHGGDATQALAKVLLVEKSPLAEAAAEALAATNDASAEAPLLRALAVGPVGLQRAAAAALGRVGTREAVAPLRELESGDAELRGEARQAIGEIHSRLGGAAPGQLSLAGGEAGRLSLTEDETGRLSLSEGEAQPAGRRKTTQ